MTKIYETHFEDFFNSVNLFNFHPSFSPSFDNFIFFGPSSVGKYSQMIHLVRNFSPSLLKYENKLFSNLDKQHDFFINISDIHFEIDMALLGCNAKILWHDLFSQIIDFISLKPHKKGFIVCKNFQDIHNELLDVFYSYFNPLSLNKFNNYYIQLKFIILTQHISFIPNNILSLSKIISFTHYHNTTHNTHPYNTHSYNTHSNTHSYNTHSNTHSNNTHSNNTHSNTHSYNTHSNTLLQHSLIQYSLEHEHEHDHVFFTISSNILSFFIHNKHLSFFHFYAFRDTLYDILIYNIDPFNIFSFIIFKLFHLKLIHHSLISHLLSLFNLSLLHFSNNYRSFFHIELIFFHISLYLLISHHLITYKLIN